ncbi:MAG: hypothetical protein JW999_12075 [Methanotrichaceae archaeon]|nr:hypothetical protein [Methanotrichaceae archaeon]
MNSASQTYSLKSPLCCTGENLAKLYRESKSIFPAQNLLNSPEMEIIDGVNWSFDPSTMTIWNNRYWKGFYPSDYDFKNLIMMYGLGFYKRFWPGKDESKGKKIMGETHPYSSDIHAANEAIDMNLKEKGKVVYIKYRDFPFNNFDDVLKIVDKDAVVGEAFVSLRTPGRGLSIFHFVLSRRYSVDFMTQADCKFIFQSKAKEAEVEEVLGTWDLLLVSNAALSSPILRFKFYRKDSDLKAGFILGGKLPQGSNTATLDENMISVLDLPSQLLNNEIRTVNKDLLVGILQKADNPIFKAMLGSRGYVTNGKDGIFLPYILKRVALP